MGAELSHMYKQTDRRADMTKLSRFRNFSKTSKNEYERNCQSISEASGENLSEGGTVNDPLAAVHTPRSTYTQQYIHPDINLANISLR